MSLPLNIPSIIGQVVANTATTLGYNIAYLHGTWNHIRERIVTAQGGYTPNAVFPLVCLVQVFEEKFKADSEYSEATLTLLICNNSQPDWYAEDRYTNNYLPTLYPIYEALMNELNQTPEIVGYKTRYFEHTKVDDLHLPETAVNKLPECLDGLWINDLKLTFDVPPCSFVPIDLCEQTPCPTGAVVDYIQAITGVTFTHSPTILGLTVSTSGTGTIVYKVEPNGGVMVGNTLNVSTALNGTYVCRVEFGTAYYEFFYEVKGGKFEHYPLSYSNTIIASTNCYNYVLNGGYRLSYSYASDYHNINSVGFIANLDGVEIANATFNSKPYTNIDTGLFQTLSPVTLDQILTFSNGRTIQSKSILKLKCQ